MLTRFDHVTIAVSDLDMAVQSYERLLGAQARWRGEAPDLGTRGALFGIGNALVELVSPRADAAEAEGLRALLESRGEGVHAIAFGTDDAQATSDLFRERGLRATAPQPGEARAADGSVRSYRTVELSARTTRGLSVYAVERPDLAALATPPTVPADTVHALDHVVIRTADVTAAIALYSEGLGIRLALDRPVAGRRMLFFRLGGVTLEVVEEPGLGNTDAFYGVTYRVRDIDGARARMAAAGVSVSEVRDGMKPNTRVFSVRDSSASVPTLILRDPGRDGA